MNLKFVTWEGDLTQFLVEADTDEEAVRQAMEANIRLSEECGEESLDEGIKSFDTYSTEDVDFEMMKDMFKRTDLLCIYPEAVVFND